MEKRLGTREHIGIGVIVDYRPAGLCRGVIRNSSISGLYVETKGQALPVNSRLDIVFLHNTDGVTHLQRVRTHIIRCDAGGYGLMLNDIYTDAVTLQIQLREKIAELAEAGEKPDNRLPLRDEVINNKSDRGENARTQKRKPLEHPAITRT